jgi:hypothetical protein
MMEKQNICLSGCYYKIQDKINSCSTLALQSYPGSTDLFNKLCKIKENANDTSQ